MWWCPLICSWQLPWYYQGIAGWSVHMNWEDLSRTWRLPGIWKAYCGHSTWFNCNCPGIVVSGTTNPSNQWIEFSPCWPIGGKLMLPPLFWLWPLTHWTGLLLHHIGCSPAILLVTLLPAWGLTPVCSSCSIQPLQHCMLPGQRQILVQVVW